jgi:hypothetical protein
MPVICFPYTDKSLHSNKSISDDYDYECWGMAINLSNEGISDLLNLANISNSLDVEINQNNESYDTTIYRVRANNSNKSFWLKTPEGRVVYVSNKMPNSDDNIYISRRVKSSARLVKGYNGIYVAFHNTYRGYNHDDDEPYIVSETRGIKIDSIQTLLDLPDSFEDFIIPIK